ncbi:hypothetical protein DERF_008417 [Dermatophagoides farinae]|uniref:Uncharacterized protein n=1 Tax=Dermatophagoides farinae TaxID=6954 RepID=A0A922I2D9_DERFA|nr:hypothetical protein DERF_008417 [Dermatophagoides farinae]
MKHMLNFQNAYETEEAKQIRKLIEHHCGVFKFSSNIKFRRSLEVFNGGGGGGSNRCITLATNELVLVSDDEDETGDPETNKIEIIINAYQSGVLANRKFDKIHCIPCDIELRDSLLLIKKHLLKDRLHLKNMMKLENQSKQYASKEFAGNKKIQQFVDTNANCLEWDGPSLIHCKVCHKVIQARYYTLIRHCQRRSHKTRLSSWLPDDNGTVLSNDENIYRQKIQMEKEKLKTLMETNQDCLLLHANKIYCRLCEKILITKYNNVLNHLGRSIHIARKAQEQNKTNDDGDDSMITTIDNNQSSQVQQNIGEIIDNLLQKEQNRLNRLIEKHSEHLILYNHCENVLCKPCKRIMLAQYINVHNHLRRQSHKDKTILYDGGGDGDTNKKKLTTEIVEITANDEDDNDDEQLVMNSVTGTVEEEQVILIEQIPMGDQLTFI